MNLSELHTSLISLWKDFDKITEKIKQELELGGELEQDSIDQYNIIRIEIIETRKKIVELGGTYVR